MIRLSLKDSRQQTLAPGVMVSIEDTWLIVSNEIFNKKFRIETKGVAQGNFWIDALSKSILVELWDTTNLMYLLNIQLSEDFEVLFPEARANWSWYFFEVHYSF